MHAYVIMKCRWGGVDSGEIQFAMAPRELRLEYIIKALLFRKTLVVG